MSEASTEQQLYALAKLLLLQQRLREAENPAELGFILVNDTHGLVPYHSALFWLAHRGSEDKGSVVSVAGSIDHDEHSPYMHWMRSLTAQLAANKPRQMVTYRRGDVSGELAEQWDTHGSESLVWYPLRTGAGAMMGAILMWREAEISESEQRVLGSWFSAASYSLAALQGKSLRPGFQWTQLRKRIAAVIAAVLALMMFMPVRLTVLAQAEIVARDPTVIRAPMDGIVSDLLVRPNAPVEEGALLLKLDDTELQTRLSVAEQTLAISRAQYQQAQSASRSANAKASLRVLALETEKRQSEVSYMKTLLQRSEVEAERDGVVIMPNPDELIGRPVVTGERLMTIADPNNTQLQAWLAVGDDITLLYDSEIDFFPNVAPDKKYSVRLRRMDYRAQLAETGELAYRIRGDFATGENLPRIGMRGTAKLHGEEVSLGYFLLRRPLATLRRWLGF